MKPIRSAPELYAHAVAIEQEAAERYAEFAAWFETRSPAVAALCRRLSELEREHFEELARACSRIELPDIAAQHYRWIEGSSSPEAAARELFYDVATPRQLLQIALQAEWRAREFFVEVARTSPSSGVRELASVMAAEETEHVRWVRDALDRSTSAADWDDLTEHGMGPGVFQPENPQR